MQATSLDIADVMLIEPKVFGDARGFFFESFNAQAFADATGVTLPFVQDNHSRSRRGVLRGLHYQLAPKAQGKLVRCVRGAVFDVAVDIRRDSPTFGRWSGAVLSEENQHQLWIPPGLAHGFVVLTDTADFLYKTTDYYSPAHERAIRWDDPAIGIDWQLAAHGITEPVLSDKDRTSARLLAEADI